MKENYLETISIPNVDKKTFLELLEFIYTGNVEINKMNIISLITASVQFQIEDLKSLCLSSFDEVVNENNIMNLLLMADLHQELELKNICIQYFLEHYFEIINTNEFKNFITGENISLILELFQQLIPKNSYSREEKKRKL